MSLLQSPTTFHKPRKSKTIADLRAVADAPVDNRPPSREGLLGPLVRLFRDPVRIVGDAVEGFRDGLTPEERAHRAHVDRQIQIQLAHLNSATKQSEWHAASVELDILEENDVWKAESNSSYYHADLVASRLRELDEARINCDVKRMLFLVRTALMRNLGDMGNIRLYKHSRVGTKNLIEQYINSALETLNALLSNSAQRCPPGLDSKEILDQVVSARQAFGRSALLLSGGATFGMSHIGVLKCLWEAKLLPRIISGASAGSIVCAIICTRSDHEIPPLLEKFPYGDLSVFESRGEEEGLLCRLGRFLTIGAWIDISHLTRVMKEMLGDLTFQEAYNRTRRILNICVSSASLYELPRLLNYVTAPNVLIWSAVAASCSVPFVFSAASLSAKDPKTGGAVPWNPSPQRYIDGSVDNDLPMTRLAELFNVNHFIVSQVNPHVVPFLAKEDESLTAECHNEPNSFGWLQLASGLAKDEALHRMHLLTELGVFPNTLTKARSVLSQKYSGDITIFPQIAYSDFPRMLKNPTTDFMLRSCLCGEKATWPKLSRIRNHCAIELALDDAVQRLRDHVVFSPSQVDLRLNTFSSNNQSSQDKGGRNRRKRNLSQSSEPPASFVPKIVLPIQSPTNAKKLGHQKSQSTGSNLAAMKPSRGFESSPTLAILSSSSTTSSPNDPTDVGGSTTQTPLCSSDADISSSDMDSCNGFDDSDTPQLGATPTTLFPYASQPTTPHTHNRFSFMTPLAATTPPGSSSEIHRRSGSSTPIGSPILGMTPSSPERQYKPLFHQVEPKKLQPGSRDTHSVEANIGRRRGYGNLELVDTGRDRNLA
ncbi:MAG: hypothetical protein M1814_005889 [Vezdaea aestivalis]|nr:MAG: hypothetical protein M1814_005889 [Vezdaea aestivalis]